MSFQRGSAKNKAAANSPASQSKSRRSPAKSTAGIQQQLSPSSLLTTTTTNANTSSKSLTEKDFAEKGTSLETKTYRASRPEFFIDYCKVLYISSW